MEIRVKLYDELAAIIGRLAANIPEEDSAGLMAASIAEEEVVTLLYRDNGRFNEARWRELVKVARETHARSLSAPRTARGEGGSSGTPRKRLSGRSDAK